MYGFILKIKKSSKAVKGYMRIRYKKDGEGLRPVARIYTDGEHGLNPASIDQDAVKSILRLKQRGFSAFIVGGAIRDILLGRVPKDFDIATDASPRQVHKLFYQARVIGKRFKLVHLVYGDKIIEVSTFRGESQDDNCNNTFGTMESDAKRRDFTINSLYYDPVENTLFDFNDSLSDFKKKRIHSVLPLATSFIEDPVRMIRAVKYSITTGFKMDFALKRAIKHDSRLLANISSSRLTEEVFKILGSGCSAQIIRSLDDYGLLVHILPCMCVYTKFPVFFDALNELDFCINSSVSHGGKCKEVERWEGFLYLTKNMIVNSPETLSPEERFNDIFRQLKVLLSPITPPNFELENVCSQYMKQNGFPIHKSSRSIKRDGARNIRKKKTVKSPAKPQKRKPRKASGSAIPESLQDI